MSFAYWGHGGLRFFSQHELMLRRHVKERLVDTMQTALQAVNKAWQLYEVEGPMLMPRSLISPSYDGDDVWLLQAKLGEDDAVMRPETTPSTYRYAEQCINSGAVRPPFCFYQIGKSFRREQSDGATAAKLRYYEFTQLEFQCIYAADSKADYRQNVLTHLKRAIESITGFEGRVVGSDRLPSYSTKTEDVELLWSPAGNKGPKTDFRWTEMCSVSDRNDFPPVSNGRQMNVLEVAVGVDRLTEVMSGNI